MYFTNILEGKKYCSNEKMSKLKQIRGERRMGGLGRKVKTSNRIRQCFFNKVYANILHTN